MFRSYESGRDGYVTLIANYLPLQDAYGGPNYFTLDPDAFYRIHIDNTGDGVEDITFQFRVVAAPARHQGPGGRQAGFRAAHTTSARSTNRRGDRSREPERPRELHLDVVRGPVRRPGQHRIRPERPRAAASASASRPTTSARSRFRTTPATPTASSRTSTSRAATPAQGRVFVGQRKEPFAVNLGEIFDLVNIANPIGPATPSRTLWRTRTSPPSRSRCRSPA